MKFTKNTPTTQEKKIANDLQTPKTFLKQFNPIKPRKYMEFDDDSIPWISTKDLIGAMFYIHRITSGVVQVSKAPKLVFKITLERPDGDFRKFSTASNGTREMMMEDLNAARQEDANAIFGPMTINVIPLSGGRTFYDICATEDAPF